MKKLSILLCSIALVGCANNASVKESSKTSVSDDPTAEDKMERNVGARIKFEIVEDEKIIEALNKANDNAIREGSTICHVVEVLPLG